MAVEVLEHNGFHVIVPKQGCCGLPLQSNGLFPAARSYVRRLAGRLWPYARAGYDVVATSTSCSLMLKREAHEILGVDDPKLLTVGERTHDICEYLVGLHDRGELRTDFRPLPLTVPYHAPCQQRGHGIGKPALELFALIPELRPIELDFECCGVAGTYGLKREKYDVAMRVGDPLFRAIRESEADLAACDSETCRWQIAAATGTPVVHPVEILHRAYGLSARRPAAGPAVVGIVIVSHSARLAEGAAELAREMAGDEVPIEPAGGMDDGGLGTDATRVMAALERAGAAGEVARADGPRERGAQRRDGARPDAARSGGSGVLLCEAPLVEGAVAAAVAARLGGGLQDVAAEARRGLAGKEAHLGDAGPRTRRRRRPPPTRPRADWDEATVVVGEPHGLHARPAARLVRAVGDLDAEVRVENLTGGRGPAPARSLSGLSALGALQGHALRVRARGPDAAAALAAVAGDRRGRRAGRASGPAARARAAGRGRDAPGRRRLARLGDRAGPPPAPVAQAVTAEPAGDPGRRARRPWTRR